MKTANIIAGIAIATALLTANVAAQQRSGFKADALGETFQDFLTKYPDTSRATVQKTCQDAVAKARAAQLEVHKKDKHVPADAPVELTAGIYTQCLASVEKVLPRNMGCSHEAPNQVHCAIITTMLGDNVVEFFEFKNGRLFEITIPFHSKDFDNVIKAAHDKYGEPSDSGTRDYQNRMGAHFSGRYLGWTQGSDIIAINEIGQEDLPFLSGEIYTAVRYRIPDNLDKSVMRITDSATTTELAKPTNAADF